MYVHKYNADGEAFYRVTKSSGKPGQAITLTVGDWKGKASERSGNVGRAMEFLKDAPWSVKEKDETEEKKEEKVEKKSTLLSTADYMRQVAWALNQE